MQFALGSVLKLTRSAFGGLGSFWTPSIRRVLPVLLGGLLCAVGSATMAQQHTITGISFVSNPSGGPSGNPNSVYIIGDKITAQVVFSEALEAGDYGTPTLKIALGDVAIPQNHREAECAVVAGNRAKLNCSYVVREGDAVESGSGTTQGVRLRAEALEDGPGAKPLPTKTYNIDPGTDKREVDGVRLSVSEVTTGSTGVGFKAGDDIVLTLTFANSESGTNLGTFGATIVMDNGVEREAASQGSLTGTSLRFRYQVAAGDNARQFTLKLTGQEALRDENGNAGLAATLKINDQFAATATRRVDTSGPQVTQIRITSANEGTLTEGSIVFEVEFNEDIGTIVGGSFVNVPANTSSLNVTVGTSSTSAACSDTGDVDEKIICTLPIVSGLEDIDGIATPANPLAFTNIKDAVGNIAVVAFPARRFEGYKIDSIHPEIASVRVTVPSGEAGKNIVIRLTFSEPVTVDGAATIPVTIGTSDGGPATFAKSSGREVEFRYPLDPDDVAGYVAGTTTEKSVSLAVAVNAAADVIEDAAGNDAELTLPEGTTASPLRLLASGTEDTDNPRVDLASLVVPEGGRLGPGDMVDISVLFSEPVTLTDATLRLQIGNAEPVQLTSTATNPAALHTFRSAALQAPQSGAVKAMEITIADNGTVYDAADRGWTNVVAGTALQDGQTRAPRVGISLRGSVTVDTAPPMIRSVKLLKAPAPSARGVDGKMYYGIGDTIRIEVTMNEDVSVDKTPLAMLALDIQSGNARQASFEDMRGKRTLIFKYEVQENDLDVDGIAVGSGGITNFAAIKDVAGSPCAAETCGFTNWGATHSADHRVNWEVSGQQVVDPITTPPTGQPVNPVGTPVVRSSTPTGGYYKTGDTITIEVPLSPPVTFTSAPQLLLNFDEGGSQRLSPAESISSNGTPLSKLTFSYRVQSGDEDLDGFTGTLSGGGTPTVEDGRRVTLGSISVPSSRVLVDARAPELDSLDITSSAGADGTYRTGDNIEVTAGFSEDVERQGTADPSVAILVGDSTKTATLQSPSSTAGGDTWVFRYTVVAGDSDADGVSIAANALEGELEDSAGNEASITHTAVAASTAHRVDTQGPRVTDVAVTGAGTDNLFVEGDTITATVTFDEEVDVATSGSNAVRVRFNIGTSQRTATYAGGDDTTTLTFTYEVVAGDSGVISLPANALEGEAEDAAGNAAGGTPAVPVTPYIVDAAAPMLEGPPTITSSPASGDTYVAGEMITVEVGFDEPVVVTGTPRIYLTVGPKRRFAAFTGASTSGADLRFAYTVRAGDMDDDGVSIAANQLRLTSGATIKDRNGLSVASSEGTVMHPAVPDQSGHKVDAVAPMVESVAITGNPASGDAYLLGETIKVTVTFSEDVTTEGSPTLGIMVGTGTRNATCAQSGGRTELMCSYTVAANDFDADGVSVNADSLSGTITDVPGNPATLTHDALADDPDHKVYAAAPEAVRTIATLSMAAGGATNSLDLDGIFTGFQLTYSASSSDTNVAVASVAGSELTVASGMEGAATVTVTATNLAGSASTTFGVIVATDPVEKAVLNDALAAIGRSMLSSTANVIGSRFELAATSSQTMALGGSRFGGSLSPEMQRLLAGNDPFALQERMGERAPFGGSGGAQQAYGGGYGLTADRLFTGTSFNMPLNALGTGDAQFAIWGAGDLQSFEGEPDDGMYDGSSSSGHIGVDARGDGWLAGVSVSRSGAEADYDFDNTARTGVRGGGTLETSVTAFHPYARLEVGPDSEIWVIGGFGGGEADLSRTHVMGSQSSDLSMAMAVGGLRRALAMEFGGADLSLRGDAGFLSLETDSGMMAVDGLSASVSRLRLGLEAAWEGESATPFVEVSGRFDGGDGQTGGGIELAGGLRILSAESGFGLEAKGRVLAMHTGEGYSESGISVTASFEPGAAGRGITFRLSPRWGGSADSTDLFWDEVGNVRDASQYAYSFDRAQTWGVDAALGYGFGLRSMPGIVTPFGQMDVTGAQDQRIRVGVRYGLMQGLLGGTQVELSAERVDGEMYRVGETRVLMSGRARF